MNLCVNARDAMHEGGVLTIRAENTTLDESSAAMIPDAQAGPYVVLEVADTGSGIPKEVLAKIFDPFFTTKEQGKGTGLGLSTVMGIVKSHGGFLKVSSEVGRGTSFRAFVPASIDARLLEEPSLVRHFRRGSGELLLVVDDEASIRNVTSTMLRKHGYEVVLAGDGTEALALYVQRQAEISAVLTDVAMPHIDGVALTRALMRLNPKVRVIASTGFGDNARMAELRSLGAAAFLSKPFTTDKLLQVVHEVLHPCGAATAGDSMA
jgi:CheY-like chemotaxis protein